MAHFNTIPQIDLQPLFEKSGIGIFDVAEQVKHAYTTVGFAYLFNHGVPEELIQSVFAAAEHFHCLPLKEKLKIQQNKSYRGYLPNNHSIIKSSTEGVAKKPNLCEAFIMAHEVDAKHPDYQAGINLAGPNQWPENFPQLKIIMTEYFNTLNALAMKMVQVFSIAFGLERNSLNHLFLHPTIFLRLQYYPEQEIFDSEEQFGLAPHTDYGFLTLLIQDSLGGLQLKNTKGDWIEAPPIPNTFILNSGDMLRRMTNDHFLSTPHRVINRSGKKRYSIPFFFEPDMHAKIDILPTFYNDLSPAKYPSILYKDHLLERIRANYSTLGV